MRALFLLAALLTASCDAGGLLVAEHRDAGAECGDGAPEAGCGGSGGAGE